MEHVYVVSGLPRSGTSLMMRMLAASGIELVTDDRRPADEDNPRGYYELDVVKRLPDDISWLDGAKGKAVKVISELLVHLPDTERYKVVFMRRHLDEIMRSQAAMLGRRGGAVGDELSVRRSFMVHLGEIEAWLAARPHFETLFVSYNRLMNDVDGQVTRIAEFLERECVADMAQVIEPALYRQRAQQR